MNKLTKIILTFLLLVTVAMGYSTVAMADSKSEKQLITEMVQEIKDLGATPIRKGLKCREKYIFVLKEQLEELQKQKEREAKKQALMDDLRKQILDLNPDAKLDTDDSTDATDELDQDKDIIALKKQLEDIKNKKAAEALMDDLRKQIKALNPDAKTAADDSTDVADELDQDKDIIALKKQLEDIKKAKKKAEQKEITKSIKAEEKKKAEKKKAEEKKKKADEKKKADKKKQALMDDLRKQILDLDPDA